MGRTTYTGISVGIEKGELMSNKNYELELYKLIITPCETTFISEFGWVSDTEFYIWVDFIWFKEFMDGVIEIFGYGIFDDANFNANIQLDSVCIDATKVFSGYGIDFERVFPKDKYRH